MEKRLFLAVIISVFILIIFQSRQPVMRHGLPPKPNTEILPTSPEVEKIKEPVGPVLSESLIPSEEMTISSEKLEVSIETAHLSITRALVTDKRGNTVDLITDDSGQIQPLAFFKNTVSSWEIKEKDNKGFTAEWYGKDLNVTRKFRIEDDILEIETEIENKTPDKLKVDLTSEWLTGLGAEKQNQKDNRNDTRIVAKIEAKIRTRLDNGIKSGSIAWAGIVNRYFTALIFDENNIFSGLDAENAKSARGCAIQKPSAAYPQVSLISEKEIDAYKNENFRLKVYIGVKEYSRLKEIDIELKEIFSFGIFGFLGLFFLNILIWFNGIFGNYGVAIILLTVLLQIVIFPLTVKSYKSMNAMKEIQPKMNSIREKFKDNPQRLNQETMELYKKHKVNPFGGCFPILLQMPIFISLFTMLRSATELKYAHFLWIKDLAEADVLFASIPAIRNIPLIGSSGPLPYMMGAAMFLQQKLTGSAEGPQKNLMYILPVMFTFMFIKFPSGLVLYWFVNSMLTFFVQLAMSRKKV